MYNAVDSTAIDQHPVQGINRGYAWFFVIWIVVGNFFIVNLFVGAVVDQFNELGSEAGEADMFQTEAQTEWVETQIQISRCRLTKELDRPLGFIRGLCFDIVHMNAFEKGIMLCIVCNTGLMACSYYQQTDAYTLGMEVLNYTFAGVFTLELVLKMLGLGPQQYLANWWNQFDLLVVLGIDVSIVLSVFFGMNIGAVASLARAFRMCQIARMLKNAPQVQSLIDTIIQNLPYMSNITSVLFLVLFIFAVMGVQLFAPVTLFGQTALSEHANFQNFPNAFITLFRCTTGEAWNSIMHDLMHNPTAPVGSLHTANHHEGFWELDSGAQPTTISLNSCYTGATPEDDYLAYKLISGMVGRDSATIGCSPGYTVTLIYFMLFLVICSFILVNLFLAVILQGFASSDEEDTSVLSPEVLKSLKLVWSEIDPKATYHISSNQVEQLFRRLDQELRINKVPIPPLGLSAAALKSSYGVELEYEQKILAKQLGNHKLPGLSVLSSSEGSTKGYVVKYGSKFTLKHLNSKGLLQSYFAPDTEPNQVVTCSDMGANNDNKASNKNMWIVRAPSSETVEGRTGDVVHNGESIRLQHAHTNRFLTLCDCAAEPTVPPNPKAVEHMAVACTTINEATSSELDDWVVELHGRDEIEAWHTGFQIRFIGNTGNMLHSHMWSPPQRSARQVTACFQKNLENLWVVGELLAGHGEPGLRRLELIQFIISLDLEDIVHVVRKLPEVDNSGSKDDHNGFDAGCVHLIDVIKKLGRRLHKQNQWRCMGGEMDEIEEKREQEEMLASIAHKKGQSTDKANTRTGYTWQERWAVRLMQQHFRIHASKKELIRRKIAKEMGMLPWDPRSAVKEMLQVVDARRNDIPRKNNTANTTISASPPSGIRAIGRPVEIREAVKATRTA
jgi:hypothetical protein